MVIENDITAATFDTIADVGPSSSSKREATVRALTGVLQMTQDPETQQVLTAMAMMNLEGEGMSDANAYFRKKLLKMGVIKPTDDETQELMAEMQGQPEDPNSVYLKAAAEEAEAKAAQARANTVKTIADAELSQAKTAETLAGIDQPQEQQPAKLDLNERKIELEIIKMERELQVAEEKHAIELMNEGVTMERGEDGRTRARSEIDVRSEQMGSQISEAVNSLKEVVQMQAQAIQSAAERTSEAQTKTAAMLTKPRKIVREKGKIVGIEIQD
jgi:hypothetical protein